jgi:hypothetical protein
MFKFVVKSERKMKKQLDDLLKKFNHGVTTGRFDNSDIGCALLYIYGFHRDVCYWVIKVRGAIADDILSERAKLYFAGERIVKLIEALRPIVLDVTPMQQQGGDYDWANANVSALTTEELEKMATYMIRKMSVSKEVDTKELNDLIKMLDSVGALPKKDKKVEDSKQVVMLEPFNDVCGCGREITVTEKMFDDYAKRLGYVVDKSSNQKYKTVSV